MTANFYPRFSYINAITLGVETVVGFTANHEFTVGEIISLRISQPYGTVQLNNSQGRVLAITDTTVTLELDSQGFYPFVYPVSGKNTPPVAVPSSSGVYPHQYVPYVNLQAAFDNKPTGSQ